MDNYKLKEIILDMDKNIYTPITLKQSEVNSTKIKAKLIFNYLEFNPNNITECKVLYNKADSKKAIQDNVSYNSSTSTVEFIIPSQVSIANGTGEMEIVLYSKENKTISSIVPLKIDRTVFNGIEESRDDWGILDKAFELAKKADELNIAEEQRKNNESTRITNETDRVSKEKDRVSKETERVNKEIERQNFEIERANNEGTRKSNETIRLNSEDTRLSNETKREENEVERVNKENERLSSELDRKTNENTRIEDESIRSKKETERQDKETERISNEDDRLNKENTRIANEAIRISSEENRISNESIRVSKESERIDAEINRQANENIRQDGYKNINEVITNFSICELYNSTKAYKKFNRVTYNGSTYECILDCQEINPTNKENWICIALKGKDGSGTGDMSKSNYDTNDNGIVDNAEKVNGFTVETNIPANAKFTDTIYDDSDIKGQINELGTDFDNYKKDYTANNGFGKTSGTSTSYVLTLNPAPISYKDGMQITIVPHVDNAPNSTLNINNLGASPILKSDGTAPKEGQIKANKPLSLVRVGNNFFISSGGKYDVGDVIPRDCISESSSLNLGWSGYTTGAKYSGCSYSASDDCICSILVDEINKPTYIQTLGVEKRSASTGALVWSKSSPKLYSCSYPKAISCEGYGSSQCIYIATDLAVERYDGLGNLLWSTDITQYAQNSIQSICCSNNHVILSCATSHKVIHVEALTGKLGWVSSVHTDWVRSVCCDDLHVYCSSDDGTVKSLDLATGSVVWSNAELLVSSTTNRWNMASCIKPSKGALFVSSNIGVLRRLYISTGVTKWICDNLGYGQSLNGLTQDTIIHRGTGNTYVLNDETGAVVSKFPSYSQDPTDTKEYHYFYSDTSRTKMEMRNYESQIILIN